MTLGALPKSAAECKTWMRAVYSAVSVASYDPAVAKPWIWKLRDPEVTYEDLRDTDGETGLDEKLFNALSIIQNAPSAKGAHQLVAEMGRRVDEEFKSGTEPSGRQMLHVIKALYEVKAEKRDFFELRHLHEFTYWGDSRLAPRVEDPLG